ncbi:MAG: hypothetical protein AB7V62_07960 [Thermoleophilia bacterium]
MRGTRSIALLAGCAVAAGIAAAAGSASAPPQGAALTENVTVANPATGFRATVPKGYKLTVAGGAYRIRGGGLAVTVRVVRTATGAKAYGQGLTRRGDRVLSRAGGKARFTMVGVGNGQRRVVTVRRRGADLLVAVALHPRARAGLGAVAARIAASVRGGTPGARAAAPGGGGGAPAPSGRLLALAPYRAPDGGATAWVPAEADWTVQSSGGALEGGGPRGSFLLGQSFNVVLPGTAPGPLPGTIVQHQYVSAIDALTQVWPKINQAVGVPMTNVRLRQVLVDATLPSFQSSGLLLFDYDLNGRRWSGVANVATDSRLSPYGTFFWQMYISVIAVPADGDPTVGAGLRLVWRSWNPSGAIAARSEAARQALSEINQTWQGVAEFRSRTADQQSRDVGCLLRSGPFIDDNARQLGLPPLLDCDSTYVRRTNL